MLKLFRALLSEFRMLPSQWRRLVPQVMEILNHSPGPNNRPSPVTLSTGQPGVTPLSTIFNEVLDYAEVPEDFVLSDEQLLTLVTETKLRLSQLHKAVVDDREARRQGERDRRNLQRKAEDAQYIVGDFVLVAKTDKKVRYAKEKLRFRWRGPFRITEVKSRTVYVVESLIEEYANAEEVHSDRLAFYHDASLNVDANLLDQIRHDSHEFEVAKLVGLGEDDDGTLKAQVRWRGFSSEFDTWEPVEQLFVDVPDRVSAYMAELEGIKDPLAVSLRRLVKSLKR